ncbi:PALM2-AKAP2 fusion protein-like [Narcine bancroftii]|uniref:PALM2-AKAP2 fusion protein-like n=1 Tax=Narcine bancroftii TaxID=1343680 RepID=UPI003831831E
MEVDNHPNSTKSVGAAAPKAVTPEPIGPDSIDTHYNDKGHNGIQNRHESLDSDVEKEIRYLDEVLEANCCEATAENGPIVPPCPEPGLAMVGSQCPSVTMEMGFLAMPLNGVGGIDEDLPLIGQQTQNEVKLNGLSPSQSSISPVANKDREQRQAETSRSTPGGGESDIIAPKKEARFELRAYHEDKKPSKLFANDERSEAYRIRKSRVSNEIAELERARLEVIRSQVVKKNPSITEKWKPPQEKSIEDQLDPDKLESHKKYAERKQKKQGGCPYPISPKQKSPAFVPLEPLSVRREDVVTEQIDFSAARRQFLKMERAPTPSGQRSQTWPGLAKGVSVPSALNSAETSRREKMAGSGRATEVTGAQGRAVQIDVSQVSLVKASKVRVVPEGGESQSETSPHREGQRKEVLCTEPAQPDTTADSGVDDEGFTRVRAVLTVLNEDGDSDNSDHCFRCVNLPAMAEEVDSGLDDLSLRSQDTTVMETLSNDFSIDNVSDSGASNETTNVSLDHSLGGSQEFSQPLTPQALTPVDRERGESSQIRECLLSDEELYKRRSPLSLDAEQHLAYQAEMVVKKAVELALAHETHTAAETGQGDPNEPEIALGSEGAPPRTALTKPSPMPRSSVQDHADLQGPVEMEPDHHKGNHCLLPAGTAKQCSTAGAVSSGPQPSLYRPEFSPFSDVASYLEPTDYTRDNIFVSHSQEPEVIAQSGPFKLRSHRQRTLSMIEQEIRAAQNREEELRQQREALKMVQNPRRLPQLAACPSRSTAPGKIEKSSPAAEGPLPSPRADSSPVEQESSGPSRSRGLMETLLEDYQVQKMKRRERRDEPNPHNGFLDFHWHNTAPCVEKWQLQSPKVIKSLEANLALLDLHQ